MERTKENYLKLIKEGCTLREMSDRMGITMKQVENDIYRKYKLKLNKDSNIRKSAELKLTKNERSLLNKLLEEREIAKILADRIFEELNGIEINIEEGNYVEIENKKSKEDMIVLISDVHVGKKTTSYDIDTFRRRLDTLKHKILSITKLHRNTSDVKNLHILLLGDILDGETIYPGQPFGIDASIIYQLKIAIEEFIRFFIELSKSYETIYIHAVPGNHGRAGKYNAKSTNYDLLFYFTLEGSLTPIVNNVKFIMPEPENKYLVTTIKKHKFMLIHGDGIKMYNGVPFYGITWKGKRWKGSIDRDIEYLVLGHFHTPNSGFQENDLEYIMNGTFVSDDDYGIEGLGLKSAPAQLILGINEKHGITWRYIIEL